MEKPNKLRVLDVGDNEQGVAARIWPDAEICTLDAPGAGHKATFLYDLVSQEFLDADLGKFDVIWMSHCLEHLPLAKIIPVLTKLKDSLKAGGSITVRVPCIEHIAEMIVVRGMAIDILNQLYGTQTNEFQFHKSAFSIPMLREILSSLGLQVKVAARQEYNIYYKDEDVTVKAVENVVTALRL